MPEQPTSTPTPLARKRQRVTVRRVPGSNRPYVRIESTPYPNDIAAVMEELRRGDPRSQEDARLRRAAQELCEGYLTEQEALLRRAEGMRNAATQFGQA